MVESNSRPASLKLSPPVLVVVVICIAVFLMQQEKNEDASNPESGSSQASASASADSTPPSSSQASPLPKVQQKTASETPAEFLSKIGRDTFQSPAGLIYRSGSADGHRLDHIMRHANDIPQKPVHGVFEGDRDEILQLIDEAWITAKKRGPPDVKKENSRGRTTITVNMKKKIGFVGGESGKRKGYPPCTKIKLVLEKDSVITAYPMQ